MKSKKRTKQEIINIAEALGFKLDYDQHKVKGKKWFRFVSQDKELDEPDLRWIWYTENDDLSNIENGRYIQRRLTKKKQIQDFLKY